MLTSKKSIEIPPRLPRRTLSPIQPDLRSASPPPPGDTLVVVFLRGAADGLHMVIPHAEDAYHRLRPRLRLPRPDDNKVPHERRTIDLDGFFGFHPALRPLLPAWQAGHLAAVHACGASDQSRSHFKAMELIERGVDNESGPNTGWIGRHLESLPGRVPSPLRAVSLGEQIPRSLYGSIPTTTLRSVADFHLDGTPSGQMFTEILHILYQGDLDPEVQGQETLQIMEDLEILSSKSSQMASAPYPDNTFSQGLKQIAILIKAEIGLEVATIDLGGWDTHFAQGVYEGIMPWLMEELSGGLAAFYNDLEDIIDRVTLVVMTEFGRRAYENASLGTDHGHGGLMLLLGGNLEGGKVISRWPGLDQESLVGPGDLAVTIDYRDVLAEILVKRLNNNGMKEVFPDYDPVPLGLLK